MPRSEAQRKADQRYAKKIVRLQIKMQPEEKKFLDAHLEKTGENVTTFVKRAIHETIEKDNRK